MSKEQIERDLRMHFADCLREAVADNADTMLRGGLGPHDTGKILIACLLREAMMGAISMQIDADTFSAICRDGYREVKGQIKKTAH